MAKVLVNFPDEFLKEIDKAADLEHRTRSSLIREALRRYLSQVKIEFTQKENETYSRPAIQPSKIIYPVTKAS